MKWQSLLAPVIASSTFPHITKINHTGLFSENSIDFLILCFWVLCCHCLECPCHTLHKVLTLAETQTSFQSTLKDRHQKYTVFWKQESGKRELKMLLWYTHSRAELDIKKFFHVHSWNFNFWNQEWKRNWTLGQATIRETS